MEQITAGFVAQSFGRRTARLLLAPAHWSACWGASLLAGKAWTWPVPAPAVAAYALVLLVTVANPARRSDHPAQLPPGRPGHGRQRRTTRPGRRDARRDRPARRDPGMADASRDPGQPGPFGR
ncbi:hypothetical protein ACFQ1L_33880 [Phytohabitans flavus]|uniref:hypothetical protein n=1 Tax=Phytohabitans flavus TaxID=1076124 RepID=UPI00156308B3|nr:hypothetical protein [Phytohabitans flavus]